MNKLQNRHLPLRLRLTIWYLLTLLTFLLLFAGFLYWQVQRSLLAQVDTALQVVAAQALVNVDMENGRPSFQNTENVNGLTRRLQGDFAIFLATADGTITDHLGQIEEIPKFVPQLGAVTIRVGDEVWRIYSEPAITQEQHTPDWLVVVQSLELVTETLAQLRLQILWALPMALLLAGVGGFFLAARALRPIEKITQTAQAITASDLHRRIAYLGAADEVGRLAATLDNMLDRLQTAFERERRLTGDVAHELRTPLAALKGHVDVTLNRPRPLEIYVEALQDIGEQADRLIRLSNDLLFMNRLEQTHLLLQQMERIDLKDFLGAVVEQIRPLATAKHITLTEELPDNLTIKGDIDLLIRLFLNLLDNAIKYTDKGSVSIKAEPQSKIVSISISDTGLGIAAEHLPHLFERFYRVESDRTRGFGDDGVGGAGLGLALAQEIARAHKGIIQVTSAPGVGTTFIVKLPLHARQPEIIS